MMSAPDVRPNEVGEFPRLAGDAGGDSRPALPDYDAWFLARTRTGHALDGLAGRVSEPNRPLAGRLADAPAEDRAKLWDDHIATLPDGVVDAWIEAVAAANPDDPPPEDELWGQPLSFKLPPVEPFPLEVYAAPSARMARHVAKAIGCPVDIPALAMLPTAGGGHRPFRQPAAQERVLRVCERLRRVRRPARRRQEPGRRDGRQPTQSDRRGALR